MPSVNERGRGEQREVEYVEKTETDKQDKRIEKTGSKELAGKKITYTPASKDVESNIFAKIKQQK